MHPAIKEALAVHEAFRRLHFTPDEISLTLSGSALYVTVKRGEKEFHALVGTQFHSTEDTLRSHWDQAVHAWNVTMSDLDRHAIYDASLISRMTTQFVAAIVMKGFSIAPIQA